MPCVCKTCTHYQGVKYKNALDERGTVRSIREGLICSMTHSLVPDGMEKCDYYDAKSSFVENVDSNGVRYHNAD